MAYTLSNEARGRTVELCADKCWAVHVACSNGHGLRIGSQELAHRFPGAATLEHLAERLVCRECGSRDGGLTILNDAGALQRRDVESFDRSAKYGAKAGDADR